jgi:hypothetical protein
MSNNKQDHIVDTNKMVNAVEWLFNNYVDKGVITIQAIEQALEMEKKQIMDAWYNGFEEIRPYVDNSEDYYKETYEQQ